jgi:hypothetical protein
MKVEFWIYLVIGIIVFLSRLLKKNEQPQGPSPESDTPRRRPGRPQAPVSETPRAMTFEELLREITEGKQAKQRAPEPPPRYATDEREVDEEARSLEEIPDQREDSRIFQAYEEAKRLATQRTSLEETLKLKDTPMAFGKFKAFETKEKKNLLNTYTSLIRNPETLKQALVMSEILKPKF